MNDLMWFTTPPTACFPLIVLYCTELVARGMSLCSLPNKCLHATLTLLHPIISLSFTYFQLSDGTVPVVAWWRFHRLSPWFVFCFCACMSFCLIRYCHSPFALRQYQSSLDTLSHWMRRCVQIFDWYWVKLSCKVVGTLSFWSEDLCNGTRNVCMYCMSMNSWGLLWC